MDRSNGVSSRTSSFTQNSPRQIYKDLRHNASEARDYFTGLEPDFMAEEKKQPLAIRPSRSSGSNN